MKKIIYIALLSITYVLSGQFWFNIVPLEQILLENPKIKYLKCTEKMPYEAPEFEILPQMPHKVIFDELFILTIPEGKVQGSRGHTVIDGNIFIREFVWFDRFDFLNEVVPIPSDQVIKVSGRVAVITQLSHVNYFHFINETLGRLALLEMHNVEYDWLYIPYDIPMIKSFLTLWGVDPNKIISPVDVYYCVQADELIIPSFNLNTDAGFRHTGIFIHPKTMNYVKQKIINNFAKERAHKSFSKKVFVSRKDGFCRRILNEDEIFELFEPLGFVRYELSKMTIEEQISLFQNAEIVVGEHGAGFANLLFCKSGTVVIELFQALVETCVWWLSLVNNLEYHPVKLLDIDLSYSLNWQQYPWIQAWNSTINVPLDAIYPVIEMLKKDQHTEKL